MSTFFFNLRQAVAWFLVTRWYLLRGYAPAIIQTTGSSFIELHSFRSGSRTPSRVTYLKATSRFGRRAYAKVAPRFESGSLVALDESADGFVYGPDHRGATIEFSFKFTNDLYELFAHYVCTGDYYACHTFHVISHLERRLQICRDRDLVNTEFRRNLMAAIRRLGGNRQAGYHRLEGALSGFARMLERFQLGEVTREKLIDYVNEPIEAGGQSPRS